MKSSVQSKPTFPRLLVTLALACFALLPRVQAVVPPPDGGYPGGNTAEGQNPLMSLTSGGFNAAIGWLSLRSLTTGSFNTGVGAGTLALNNADQNTATGAGALLFNSTGIGNTANGAFALFFNTIGNSNTANGLSALQSNTTGGFNTATGSFALTSNTAGSNNTAHGSGALESNTGSENTAIGSGALLFNTTASHNTATGFQALLSNTASDNTAYGHQALLSNTTGVSNTATGHFALSDNTTGNGNTASGVGALGNNMSGNNNTAIGLGALGANTTGGANTALGLTAGLGITTADNVIVIGALGSDVSSSCFIGHIRGVTTANANAIPVVIDSDSQLGTISSSRRFKKEIRPMDKASEAILALKPMTFYYKSDKTNTPQFGLVAEDVADVNPDLVVRDENGAIYTVRYDAVNAMLLNEFLKEHRKVDQLEKDLRSTIAEQQKRIEMLTAGLQEVSTQLEMSKATPQTVLNNQ